MHAVPLSARPFDHNSAPSGALGADATAENTHGRIMRRRIPEFGDALPVGLACSLAGKRAIEQLPWRRSTKRRTPPASETTGAAGRAQLYGPPRQYEQHYTIRIIEDDVFNRYLL